MCETRLRKLEEGVADGTILAYAGLKRLGLGRCRHRSDAARRLSAGAGARRDLHRDAASATASVEAMLLRHQRCRRPRQALACERAFLAALDGSCRTPIAGYAKCRGRARAFPA